MKTKISIYISLLIYLVVAFSLNSYSQDNFKDLSFTKKWKLAEQYLAEEQYYEASRIFESLFEEKSNNHHIAYKIGFLNLINEEKQDVNTAIDYLEMASENVSKRYRNSHRNSKAPIKTFYFLGVAYRLNQEYDKALSSYRYFEDNMTRKDKRSVQGQFIDREIQSCINAMESINFDYMKVEKLVISGLDDPNIRCPILCHEANILIFTNGNNNVFPPDINYDKDASDGPFDKVFMAFRSDDGTFHSPEMISDDLDIPYPYLPVTATANAEELYLVVDEGDRGQLYMSNLIDGKWQKAQPVNLGEWTCGMQTEMKMGYGKIL